MGRQIGLIPGYLKIALTVCYLLYITHHDSDSGYLCCELQGRMWRIAGMMKWNSTASTTLVSLPVLVSLSCMALSPSLGSLSLCLCLLLVVLKLPNMPVLYPPSPQHGPHVYTDPGNIPAWLRTKISPLEPCTYWEIDFHAFLHASGCKKINKHSEYANYSKEV